MDEPFSRALRRSTMEVHEQARLSPFMGALLAGELPLARYTLLAEQYRAIYGALEAVSDVFADHPVAGPFVVDELRRVPSLDTDLAALRTSEGHTPRILDATRAYVARICDAIDDPPRFVAHHYTRYLGDIAGGQAVGRMLARTYGIEGPGRLFYDFGALGGAPRFRDRYRALLDAAPWDADERERLVAESVHAFGLNSAVFDELADVVSREPALAS